MKQIALQVFALFAIAPAIAQSTADQIEEIIVTGSRIPHSSYNASRSIAIIDQQQIRQAGINNINDLMRKLPMLAAGESRATASEENAGIELANLRGLGTARTLILLNGKRHVGSDISASAVDLSSLPIIMLERVEVITGAASAVYGADAVSGVINFITKKKIEETQIDINFGQSSRDDGNAVNIAIADSHQLNPDASLTWSFSYEDRAAVYAKDRYYSSRGLFWFTDTNANAPAKNRMVENLSVSVVNEAGIAWNLDETGLSPLGSLGFVTFDSQGRAVPFDFGDECESVICTNGNGLTVDKYATLSTSAERYLGTLSLQHDFDQHSLQFDIKYSVSKATDIGQPSFSDGGNGPIMFISAYNPFIDAEFQQNLLAQGIAQFAMTKAHADLGQSPTQNRIDTVQAYATLFGELTDDIDYQFSLQHGQSKQIHQRQDRLINEYQSALNSTRLLNKIVCADLSPGCQPLNPFGDNAASAQAREYIMTTSQIENLLEQSVAEFSITTEIGDWFSGPVQLAAGLEYRLDDAKRVPDQLLQEQLTSTSYLAPILPASGSFHSWELFSELRIPLLQDKWMAKRVSLDLALRASYYSSVERVLTYTSAINWHINDDWQWRLSHGLAARAPNVAELYAPEITSFERIQDPCDKDNLTKTQHIETRQANCAALGLSQDFDSLSDATGRAVVQQGNSNLSQEKATSWTLGLVYQPDAIENLSVALDVWSFHIEDAIEVLDINDVTDACVDFGEVDNDPFCQAITRSTNGQIERINLTFLNVAQLKTYGYDIQLDYHQPLTDTLDWSVALMAGHVYQRDFQLNPNAPQDILEELNTADLPKTRGVLDTSISGQDWSIGLDFEFIGSSRYDNTVDKGTYPQDKLDSVIYTDLTASYQINDHWQAYLSIHNLTDKKPFQLPAMDKGGEIYDAIGRYFFIGFNRALTH